jgi:hypothetical protein
MNNDSVFCIGISHIVCEDYACSGTHEDQTYAIISDGCSSSENSCLGARLLTLSAREILMRYSEYEYDTFGANVISRVNTIYDSYPSLHCQALDATLLTAQVKNNRVKGFIYGDGVFIHKSTKGLYAMRVNLNTGAPDYLSYNLDMERKKSYDELGGIKIVDYIDENGKGRYECKPFSPIVIDRPVECGDIIAICSDGINSFRQPDNTLILWTELLNEFVGFKNFAGVFVKRRLAAFKKKCLKEGITHSDDISLAAIQI